MEPKRRAPISTQSSIADACATAATGRNFSRACGVVDARRAIDRLVAATHEQYKNALVRTYRYNDTLRKQNAALLSAKADLRKRVAELEAERTQLLRRVTMTSTYSSLDDSYPEVF